MVAIIQKKSKLTCSIQNRCGSCTYINKPYTPSLDRKYNQNMLILKKADVLGSARVIRLEGKSKSLNYRHTAKLAVGPGKGQQRFALGLYKPGSQEIVDMQNCAVHTSAIDDCLAKIRQGLESSEISPWDPSTQEGDLRYLVLRNTAKTNEIGLTFICSSEKPRAELRQIANSIKSRNYRITSAYLNIKDHQGNAIFGSKSLRLLGKERLRDHLCGFKFVVHPRSFFQVNPTQAERLYGRIEQLVGRSNMAVAWDLYSGIGTISMVLARAGFRVISMEENPHAVEDARKNAQANGYEGRITALVGKVEEGQAQLVQQPQLIVANPSRHGLAPQAAEFLCKIMKNTQVQMLYVSCDAKSLARDLQILTNSGYRVRQIEAFDMFPHTEHLEWLCVLTS